MARLYCAFLVRCWQVGDDVQRFEIEHVQSGGKVRLDSVTATTDWISRCLRSTAGGCLTPPIEQADRPDNSEAHD